MDLSIFIESFSRSVFKPLKRFSHYIFLCATVETVAYT